MTINDYRVVEITTFPESAGEVFFSTVRLASRDAHDEKHNEKVRESIRSVQNSNCLWRIDYYVGDRASSSFWCTNITGLEKYYKRGDEGSKEGTPISMEYFAARVVRFWTD